MNDREHRDVQTLLGAYALNATSTLEARRVERHLSACDDCTHEIGLLRESAAELSLLPDPADADELVERISLSLPGRRRLLARVSAGVAAVAVAAAAVLGVALIRERSQSGRIETVLANASRRVSLGPERGFEGRGVVHIASDKAVLVLEDIPDPGRDRTYQLWAIAGGKPRSIAVIDGARRVVRLFVWRGTADQFAVTIEPAGGSIVPTADPVLVGS